MYESKLDILFTSDQVQWLDMDDQGLSVQGVVPTSSLSLT